MLRFEEVSAQGESLGFVKQVKLCGKLSELLLMATRTLRPIADLER